MLGAASLLRCWLQCIRSGLIQSHSQLSKLSSVTHVWHIGTTEVNAMTCHDAMFVQLPLISVIQQKRCLVFFAPRLPRCPTYTLLHWHRIWRTFTSKPSLTNLSNCTVSYPKQKRVQFLRFVKDGLDVKVRQILCECSKLYVGQSRRTIEARSKNTRHTQDWINLASRQWQTGHRIDFSITYISDRTSWHIDSLVREKLTRDWTKRQWPHIKLGLVYRNRHVNKEARLCPQALTEIMTNYEENAREFIYMTLTDIGGILFTLWREERLFLKRWITGRSTLTRLLAQETSIESCSPSGICRCRCSVCVL